MKERLRACKQLGRRGGTRDGGTSGHRLATHPVHPVHLGVDVKSTNEGSPRRGQSVAGKDAGHGWEAWQEKAVTRPHGSINTAIPVTRWHA